MHLAQVTQAVPCGVEIVWGVVANSSARHRVVEDEARAADQVAMAAIVDRAVVLEIVEEAAGRIDRARVVERHGLRDVPAQERRRNGSRCRRYALMPAAP